LTNIERSLATPRQNEIDSAATHLFSALQHRLSRPIPVCPINPNTRLPLQPAIRDIHHDHVLFTGDEVTGLIDFGAMRIDTPLTDIARLVGSLVGDNTPARRAAFNVYSEFRPLAEGDERLIDWLDGTALVIAAHNWLRWLYIERRDMGPTAPIVQRIEEINRRLAIE
jgi:homoserine kinase type II